MHHALYPPPGATKDQPATLLSRLDAKTREKGAIGFGRPGDNRCHVAVAWPGDLFDAEHLASLGPKAKQHIFETCRDAIHAATHMVAILDGSQVDDGTAWEIGYAYARGLPVWGLRTDFRNGGTRPTLSQTP